MKAKDVMEWLLKCGRNEDGCGKLLTDAAALMSVFVPGDDAVDDHI